MPSEFLAGGGTHSAGRNSQFLIEKQGTRRTARLQTVPVMRCQRGAVSCSADVLADSVRLTVNDDAGLLVTRKIVLCFHNSFFLLMRAIALPCLCETDQQFGCDRLSGGLDMTF